MRKKWLFYSLLALLVLLFAFSLFQLLRINSAYKASQDEYSSILEQGVTIAATSSDDAGSDPPDNEDPSALLRVDYQTLKELNSDYSGWIEIPNTSINYPIVYYTDNDYYLHHTFLGSYNTSGCIFLDTRTSSDFSGDHTIIYGHRMNDGTMFADLKKYFDPNFYTENRTLHIYTENELLTYEIFAIREVSVEDNCYTFSFSSDTAYENWLSQMKNQSSVSTLLQPDSSMSTITLSTCVYNQTTSRNIVQAQLIDRQPITQQ